MSSTNSRTAEKAFLIILIGSMITTCISDEPRDENSSPQIVVDEEGNSYLAWMGFRSSCDKRQGIYWVKIDAEGIPSSIQKVSNHPDNMGNGQWDPQIAVDKQKISYIVWRGPTRGNSEVYWAKVHANGIPGDAVKIPACPDDIEGHRSNIRIDVDAQGNSYMAWDSNWNEIYWTKIDSEGTLREAVNVSAHPNEVEYKEYNPRIAADARGNSYAVWEGLHTDENSNASDNCIYWVRIDANGVPGSIQKISTHPNDVCIGVDAAGNSYVVWDALVRDGSDIRAEGMYWVKIDAEGIQSTIQRISAYPENVQCEELNPRMVTDAAGNSYVTWGSLFKEDSEDDTEIGRIHWVRIDTHGVPGEVLTISGRPDNLRERIWGPEISIDTHGNSFLVWEGKRGRDIEVYWVRIDVDGVPGEILKLSTYSDSRKFEDLDPQIAADTEGNSYVAWYTLRWHVDVGVPYYVYWVRIDAEGIPGELRKISVGDLQCESQIEDNKDEISFFSSAFLIYYSSVVLVGFALLLIMKHKSRLLGFPI